ncbi:hypothetical protein T231_08315 [Tannerella sp. oral taxon BU063 isolate Cell 6/7/9]|uniref:DUF3408 domain-containing protein n=2 Tax=Tannerella serpentiformis TaxID=712710 RepID=W2CRW0_9BACT|nr:hypothetical protein T231_08315 [Tannerella sp. oral taxon BU063 isolate Cell 6/7/9]
MEQPELPASLSIQRTRQSSCQHHFFSSVPFLGGQTRKARRSLCVCSLPISGRSSCESATTPKRTSAKMKRGTLEAYKQTFLVPVKLTDRRAVYLSRATQERADFVVRRLGDRGANLSSFVERIVRAHLEDYAEEIEEWRKL